MQKAFIFLVTSLFGILLFSEACWAQVDTANKSFTLTPFFQEVTLLENQSEAIFEVEIKNNTTEAAVFKLSVIDFATLDESGGVAFLGLADDLQNKYGLTSWIELEKDGLVVDSNSSQSIKIKIKNRESLSPGGHYAAIMAKLEDEKKWEDRITEVDFTQSMATLIFARKIGGEIYGLELKNREIDKGVFNLPQKIQLRFQNTGNVHLTPRGLIKIIDPLGREILRGAVNDGSSIILPETFRIMPVYLKKMAVAFLPGKYRLDIEYRYDGKNDFTAVQQTIFLVPSIFVLFCLFVVGLPMGYGYFRFKQKRKNSLSEKEN
jgi:hypothetical protein